MRVVRVRLQRFRGFADMVLCPVGHAVVVGEPRAGRTDMITGLRRVLEPRSTMARPDVLDVYRPFPPAGEDLEELTEVEVTLVDLNAVVEQELENWLDLIDPETGLLAAHEQADEAVMGLRLCYRLRYDPASETAEHWVEYPKTGTRASRAERELLAPIVLDRRAPLQLRPEGVFRRLVADADEPDLLAALTKLGTDMDAATDALVASSGIRKTIEEVLDAGAAQLLEMSSTVPADDIGFATDDGSVSAILRAMRPTVALDSAGPLPLTAHGSTTTGVLTAAEAVVSAAEPGAIVLGDDFGDDLDAASAEYLASRLRRNSGQVWLSTRRPEAVRAFAPEEMIRLTRSHGQRRAHQLAATTDRKERAARRYLHPLLLPAMTARTVGLLEGPHDLEGYTAVADRRLRNDIAPPAAYGVRMVAPANGDGGKDELPKLARLATALGFHVRVVLDNDKPGGDAALIAELTALAEHVIRLPKHSSVEKALVSGVDVSRLRTAFERLVTEHGLVGITVSAIADADLAEAIVKALKSKGGLHQPFVDALPRGKTPPLAKKVLDTLANPPATTGLVDLP
ncbi:hypothetical protein DFJ67_3528 [Asanoa ferruginea]|uniref:ATP-dependent endonuclease of OLD family n=1 Tax=Asanoa ferruginea TaxID=53367 RepID=A0A3D9ZJB5_9ACTN|nr:hypothetical protein [Asanoa ferruginea]REF97526.1 hypothetical protein DFJ67_3528 [Asanoa ferruginea]GIF48185.1 hypothetical protein Afe04nite_27240 [Asanoa ferruginea]